MTDVVSPDGYDSYQLRAEIQRYAEDDDLLRVLKPGSVALWVGTLKNFNGDDEVQHSLEDDIHETVLFAIAAGNPEFKDLAVEALATLKYEFARWCA